MGILNYEQMRLDECKKELQNSTDEELKNIANNAAKTSLLLVNTKKKEYQIAAFQLLRERRNK